MPTPPLVKEKMKGILKSRVLVHRGFYAYLFNNKRIENQRYETILHDLEPLITEGYKLYVTGHSLGAALATLLSFQLAGSDLEWLPKPISCITYSSPFVGTKGFRTAFEQLEEDGNLRCLRILNTKDIVPTIPCFSFSLIPRLYKHVGINLRLSHKGYEFVYPTGLNFWTGIVNACKSIVFKPFWRVGYFHSIELQYVRLMENKSTFEEKHINQIYQDPTIVGSDFHRTELTTTKCLCIDDTQNMP
jgi:hypothetical protein